MESLLETKKDTEEKLRAFRKQISYFTELDDIHDEQVLKQVLQRLIQKIEGNKVQLKPCITTFPVLSD
ncbi:hypothetical protein BK124_25150 [Paenibacillus amylolyticus]|nr:hypothetical protein BK124_25150 [Paenibacillus amylolyticus]